MHSCDRFTVPGSFRIPETEILESPSVPGSLQKNKHFDEPKGIKVYIYESEGSIPHCHVLDPESNREACVRLDKPEYFSHGNKAWEFDSKTKKIFAEFMESYIIHGKTKIQRWEYCFLSWNGANEDFPMKNSTTIPDYRKLP